MVSLKRVHFQGFTYVAPSVLEEMSNVRLVTARSPRRTPRGRGEEHMLRVFPGASSSIAGISNQPQQFYPNTSHLQNNNNLHNQRHPIFRQSPHLLGFANTPTDDTNMMDVQLPPV
jgi:hypothetical protein